MFDSIRHYLAVLLLLSIPMPVIYWLILHPFVSFWRWFPPVVPFIGVVAATVPVLALIYRYRSSLLARDFGTSYPLAIIGLGLIAGSTVLFIRLKRELKLPVQIGLAEIRKENAPDKLITAGIYSRIRHPRYVELSLTFLGCSLVANHAVVYLFLLLSLPGLRLVVVFEERELHRRFGSAYADYCRRVPRFIPRRRGAGEPDIDSA